VTSATIISTVEGTGAADGDTWISPDGSTWTLLGSASTPTFTTYNTHAVDGYNSFYVKLQKNSSYSDYLQVGNLKIWATLNTTSTNNTFLAWKTGTNTVNITSYGNAVSSSLDPSLKANVWLIEGGPIPLPIFPGFSSFNTAGTAPFTTYLYDQSTNLTGSETFSWLLGDGNTSTSKNLYYTWNITGTYSVNHSVSNGVTTSWKNVSDMIAVGTPVPPVVAPVASFYGGPQIGGVPLTVFFTDVSTNTPTSWNWSMGDGTFNESQNPTHIYTGSGFFTVSLTATNSAGSNTTSQNNFVMVQ
jgi:PKD repeat protein